MFNTKRPPSYFLDTLFGCYCLGGYTKAAEDVCPRPLYWFAVCCFSLLFQPVVFSLLFTFSFLLFCTEIYSHTSLMLRSLMASLYASPPCKWFDRSPFVPLSFTDPDPAMKFCISMRVTSVFGVLYAFLFIMLYFYLGYLLDYFLAVHYVYTLLQSVKAVAYILAIQVIYLTVYCGFGLDVVNACGLTVDVDLSTSA